MQSIASTGEMEVVVVDNGSQDGTRDVVAAAQKSAPCAVRYVYEGRVGLSRARNTGVAAARGEFVAFTDDDAVAEPDWAGELLESFRHTPAACVGGKVIARMEGDVPWWVTERVRRAITPSYDLGDQPLEIVVSGSQPMPWGGNLALTRGAVERHGGFREDVGMVGRIARGGEDTELCIRMGRAGEKIVYWPRAVVRHSHMAGEFSLPAVIGWAYRRGKSHFRTVEACGGRRPAWRELCSIGVEGLRSIRAVGRAAVRRNADGVLLGALDMISEVGRLRCELGRLARAI